MRLRSLLHPTRCVPVLLLLLLAACDMPEAEDPCPCEDATADMSTEEALFIDLLNEYRAGEGLGELLPSRALFEAEHRQALDMCVNDMPAGHIGSDDSTMYGRSADAGYDCGDCFDGTCAYENAGCSGGTCVTAQAALDAWKASVCHDAVMANRDASAHDECNNVDWTGFEWAVVGVAFSGCKATMAVGECPDDPPAAE
jgi:hypothetical protein